jgi:hypothetical protein
MREFVQVIYKWPSGRNEVRYTAEKGTESYDKHILNILDLQARDGVECPYSLKFITK